MIKILAIDDIDDNLNCLETIIKDAFPGSLFISAMDGKSGIELAIANDPDVILLDIIMPDMDGFEVCQILKQDNSVADIPVIFLTSISDIRENRIKALEAGAEAFLSKPFDEIELTAQIRAMVKIKASISRKLFENKRLELLVAERTHELEESEQKYRLLFEASSMGISYFSTDGIVVSMNKIAASFMGGKPEDFIGKSFYELYPEKQASIYMKRIKKAIKLKNPQKYEEKSYSPNGTKWIEIVIVRVQDKENNVVGISLIFKDITKSKQAEEALKESEAKYHDIFINSPIGIWDEDFSEVKQRFDFLRSTGITDFRGYLDANPQETDYLASLVRILNVNDVTIKMMGCETREQFSLGLKDFFTDESMVVFKEEMIALESGKMHFECEIPAKTLSGQKRIFKLALVVPNDFTSSLSRVLVSCQDITDHKIKEEALNKSHELLVKLTDQVPGVVFQFRLFPDGHSCFPYASPGAFDFGVNPEDVKEDASPVFSLLQRDDYQLFMETVTASADSLSLFHLEFQVKIWGKGVCWLLCDAKPERMEDGSTLWHGIISDITVRKIAEEKLRESEARFRGIFDNSDIGIRIVNSNGIVIDENNQLKIITGFGHHEIVGHTLWDVYYNQLPKSKKTSKYLDKIKKECLSGLKTGVFGFLSSGDEEQIHCKNGSIKTVKTSYFSIKDKRGFVTYCLISDATDIINVQNEIRKLQKAIESSEVSVVITDYDGNIEYANPIFSELSGYLPAEYMGKSQSFLRSDYHNDEFYANLWSTIKSGQTWRGEFYNRKKNGEYYWENAVISPIKNDRQKITHFVAIKTDVTESKWINTELFAAKVKAEEANRLKTALLSNLSHEIRTPMNAIVGFAGLMANADANEISVFSDIILSSSFELLEMIDNMILLSRIQSGNISIENVNFSPARLIRDIYRKFDNTRSKKDVAFLLSIPAHYMDLMVQSDEFKIKNILIQLVSNALKFTQEGSVELGFDFHDGNLQFYVQDTGIGIQEQEKQKIFESFYRGQNALSSAIRGSGLGLRIAKEFSDMLGAEIGVNSDHCPGSLFYLSIPIELPLKVPSIHSDSSPSASNPVKMDILIVDDEVPNFEHFNYFLKGEAKKINHAINGREAIDMALKNKYDLILMDVKMPVMDGIQATIELKRKFPELPIIVLTAHSTPNEKDKAIQAGCDDFLPKSIKREKLVEIVNRYRV
ncbi:MAG: PAS domain S-box protein [Mariniphaga sp.]